MDQPGEDFTKPIDIKEIQEEVDPMIGNILDERYQVEANLGAGGMGAVYKARHIEMGKEVAVKVLHPQFGFDEKIVSRFKQEIEVMSSLAHPNIITIQDIGTTPYKTPYFVMEYLNCMSLNEVIEGGQKLSGKEALNILLQIADALAHAHLKGIVHRDLKPANILLIPSEDRLFVKIVDLGIAKAVRPDGGSAQVQLTQTGEVFGSPQYMSPEQCRGDGQDERTDIYAIGCLIYAMLAGRPPFVQKSAMLTIMSHLNDEPQRLRELIDEDILSPEVEALESLALKCLEKDPENRTQTMSQLLVDLRNIADGKYSQNPIKKKTRELKQEILPDTIGDSKKKKRDILIASIAVLIFCFGVGATLLVSQGFQQFSSLFQNQSNTSSNSSTSNQAYLNQIEKYKSMTPNDYLMQALNKMDHPKYATEFEPREGDTSTVRVFSVYHGKPTGNFTEVIEGKVDVNVSEKNPTLVLVLNAYMPTTWKINRSSPAVKIKEIIAVGFYPQKVEGAPSDTKITRVYSPFVNEDGSIADHRTHKNAFEVFNYIYTAGDKVTTQPEFKRMRKSLLEYTGSKIRSFIGTRATDHFNVK